VTEPVVIGNATLYLGDCSEILPTLPKVDAVVTDPPYGMGYDPSKPRGGGKVFGGTVMRDQIHKPIVGDDRPFDPAMIIALGVPTIIWGANHFASRLPDNPAWLIWDKRDGGAVNDFSDCELAWCSFGKATRLHRQMWNGVCRAGKDNMAIAGARVHPNQKPIELLDWCVNRVKGETVLDPYMGSGTTGVACANLRRKFIGIEIERKYFDIACERIENAQRQARMFA
jgi:site-specific DNA-methyltransferase (adenine-specific)